MSVDDKILLANLSFDRLWHQRYQFIKNKIEANDKKVEVFSNGVPHSFYFFFKTLCVMKEDEMNYANIKDKFKDIYGTPISDAGISRAVLFLSSYHEEKERTLWNTSKKFGVMGLVETAYGNDVSVRYVKLTDAGLNLKKVLISGQQTASSAIKRVINI